MATGYGYKAFTSSLWKNSTYGEEKALNPNLMMKRDASAEVAQLDFPGQGEHPMPLGRCG